MAYLKTHHYGGIRKYQWVTIPLELHGIVVKKDGSSVDISIGGKEGEPQFVITDLLPHLGREQGKKPLNEAVPSENLNILIGSVPEPDDDGSDRVKLAVLRILNEKYGICEEDFLSAELEAVPAAKAVDVGFDRGLIGAYGHDDRVCAYAELAALFSTENPEKTAVCIFADKEEIGSEGVSGMKCEAFEAFVGDMCKVQGVELRECFFRSFCLSCDVTSAYDPNFSEVYERRNSAYINYGVGLCKYTGAGGKSGASDASAEVVGKIRKALRENGVQLQMSELGKTEVGGGGTVAKYMANRNIDTLDAGVPVLSMHAPFETVSKYDCYMTYRCMQVVFGL
jgi:aspartyl aminopeptidase